VQWSSDLAVWNTLLTMNISGLAGSIQITDFGTTADSATLFCRIKLPLDVDFF
jgi:hypothetical protein